MEDLPVLLIIVGSFLLGFIIALLYYEFAKKPIPEFLLLIIGIIYVITGGIVITNIRGESFDNDESIIILVASAFQIIPYYLGSYVFKYKKKKEGK